MNNIVIDASVAAKWFFREKDTKEAERLIDELTYFLVPAYFLIEMDSIISKKVRRGEVIVKKAQEVRKKVRTLPFKLIGYKEICKLSFDLATSLPVTLYDAMYVAVAVNHEAILYTADQKLVNSLNNTMFSSYIKSLRHLD